MEIFITLLMLLIGFVVIIKGGDFFVNSSIWLAKRTGIPKIIIGATIVSLGTTTPEILVSLISVLQGIAKPELATGFNEIAIGNAVGSMLCNLALVLAIVIIIKPPKTEGRSFIEKAFALIIILFFLILFAITNSTLSIAEGIILLVLFALFMAMNVIDAKRKNSEETDCMIKEEKEEAKKEKSWYMIALFIVGAVAIAVGAYLLSTYGEKLARMLGVPAQIIGITVIAFGTSLPELVTSFTALKKGSCEIGIGNIIGANVINSTLLLGIISVVSGSGLPVDAITKNVALWVLLAITLLLCIPSILKKKTMKWQGYAMLALYIGFLIYNIVAVV